MNWRNIKDEQPEIDQRIYIWSRNFEGGVIGWDIYTDDSEFRSWTHWIPAEELAGPEPTTDVNPKGKWVFEHPEWLYLIDGEYAAVSILPPDPSDLMDDEYQISIGYPSNIKAQHFLGGRSLSSVKQEAEKIAYEYLSKNPIPDLDS